MKSLQIISEKGGLDYKVATLDVNAARKLISALSAVFGLSQEDISIGSLREHMIDTLMVQIEKENGVKL